MGGGSHGWGLQVVELEVGPGGGLQPAEQQHGEQQQQQHAQDGRRDHRVPRYPEQDRSVSARGGTQQWAVPPSDHCPPLGAV